MAFPPAGEAPGAGELREDALLGGRLRLLQPRRGFRSGEDALWLAAAVAAAPGESALELGTGAGAAILALGARVPGLALAGLEVRPDLAALARRNAALNGLALEVLEGCVAAPPPALGGRAFDHVLMNPPFFDRARSTPSPDPAREGARGEAAPLAAWTGLAARRLRPGGRLVLVMDAARLPELLAALPPALGSAELRPLSAARLLLRARKGGRAPFRLHAPPLAARGPVLRGGGALPWP